MATLTPSSDYLDRMAETITEIMCHAVAPAIIVTAAPATPGRETFVVMALNQDSAKMLDMMDRLGFDFSTVENGLTSNIIKYYTFGRDYDPFVPEV